MVKRKLYKKKLRGEKRTKFGPDSSFLKKTMKVNNKKRVSKLKKSCCKGERKREIGNCSSSSHGSSQSSNWGDPPPKKRKVSSNKKGHNKKFKPKHRCTRPRNVQKKKISKRKQVLQTRYRNPSFCGSCESVEVKSYDSRKLKHIELPRSSSFKCITAKSSTHLSKSFSSLVAEKEECANINDLDGVTFVTKTHPDGSSTEISFQSTLLMCVRKTAATEDLRSDSTKSAERIIDSSELNNLLSEVSAGSRGLYKCDSSHLLKVAMHNNMLRLKSSQNFTDLDFQRMSQKTINNSVHSRSALHEILSPRSMQQSETNTFFNSTSTLRATRNKIGDHKLFDEVMSYDQFLKRSLPISQSQISRLHQSHSRNRSLLRLSPSCESTPVHQHHSQTSTVQVKAVVHRDGEHM